MLKEKTKTTIVSDCSYWLVFCTKYRKEVLVGEVEQSLRKRIEEKLMESGLELLSLKIEPSFVVLEVKVDPQIAVHQLVRQLKACTSKSLRAEFEALKTTLPSLWTLNYFCTTKKTIKDKEIQAYVQSQKKRRE